MTPLLHLRLAVRRHHPTFASEELNSWIQEMAQGDVHAASQGAAKVVECRFFSLMTVQETASALGISPRTCARDWQSARTALRGYLE